jgi:flagellar basal body-associated protein FliL
MAEIIAQNPKKSNKLLIVIIIIVIILVAAYFVWQNLSKEDNLSDVNNPQIVSSGNKLPDGFLSGLPIESNVEFKEAYTASYPGSDNKIQRTVSYYSSQDLTQAFKVFSDYITANKWTIVNKIENSTMKFVYAKQGENELNISLAKDDLTQKVLVTISYLGSK